MVNVICHFTPCWPVPSFQPPWVSNRGLAEAGPKALPSLFGISWATMVCPVPGARARGPRRQARGWPGKESPNGSRLTLGPSQQRDLVCETLKPRKGRSPLPVWSWLLRGVDVTGTSESGKEQTFGVGRPRCDSGSTARSLTTHACTGHAASAHGNVTDPKQPAHQCVEDTQTRLPPARPTCSKRQGNGANGPPAAGWH